MLSGRMKASAAGASSLAQMTGQFKMHESRASAPSAGSTSDLGGNLVGKPVPYFRPDFYSFILIFFGFD